MLWLEGNLKHYANQKLNSNFEVEPICLTPEKYKIFKAGLAEVTYNLQESQDFFEASLDGRLQLYHEMERDMIKAQLESLKEYPEDSERRKHFQSELEKDLVFVEENMVDNPKVKKHREQMQQMHKDFYALLKWQRKKMIAILDDDPEKIDGDVVQLKKDLEEMLLKKTEEKVFQSKFDTSKEEAEHNPNLNPNPNPSPNPNPNGGVCPMGGGSGGSGKSCPVDHSKMAKAFVQMNEDGKREGFIHKLYEKDVDTQ